MFWAPDRHAYLHFPLNCFDEKKYDDNSHVWKRLSLNSSQNGEHGHVELIGHSGDGHDLHYAGPSRFWDKLLPATCLAPLEGERCTLAGDLDILIGLIVSTTTLDYALTAIDGTFRPRDDSTKYSPFKGLLCESKPLLASYIGCTSWLTTENSAYISRCDGRNQIWSFSSWQEPTQSLGRRGLWRNLQLSLCECTSTLFVSCSKTVELFSPRRMTTRIKRRHWKEIFRCAVRWKCSHSFVFRHDDKGDVVFISNFLLWLSSLFYHESPRRHHDGAWILDVA